MGGPEPGPLTASRLPLEKQEAGRRGCPCAPGIGVAWTPSFGSHSTMGAGGLFLCSGLRMSPGAGGAEISDTRAQCAIWHEAGRRECGHSSPPPSQPLCGADFPSLFPILSPSIQLPCHHVNQPQRRLTLRGHRSCSEKVPKWGTQGGMAGSSSVEGRWCQPHRSGMSITETWAPVRENHPTTQPLYV